MFPWERTSGDAASGHLPDDQAVAVHVGHDVGLEVVLVEALVQDLGGHVAPRPDPGAQRDVHLAGVAMATQFNNMCFIRERSDDSFNKGLSGRCFPAD